MPHQTWFEYISSKKDDTTNAEEKKPDGLAVAFWNYGWLCPMCGRGNAPFVSTCPCVPYIAPMIGYPPDVTC